ncbi:hypothetical protein KCP77_10675 [Salmonella enterica subsp. enterica]|nr:hypothetical protein KCP77_10675 [Salmonella enterica subsp. enterica]
MTRQQSGESDIRSGEKPRRRQRARLTAPTGRLRIKSCARAACRRGQKTI